MSDFDKRLQQEFLRSKRYGRPLTIMLVKARREDEILADLKEEVQLFLSNLCSGSLRETDALFIQGTHTPLTIMLLETTQDQALHVKTRIEQRLKRYLHKPYGDGKPLDLAFGIASFVEAMKTPQDLLQAASLELK